MLKPAHAGAALASMFVLTACASGEGQRPQEGGTPPPRDRPALFISPCGQPFRSQPGEPYPVARWFAQVDRKGDGHVTRAEFRADAEAFFKLLDLNNDGVIDGFELATYEHSQVPEIIGVYGGGVAAGAPADAGERRSRRERDDRPGGDSAATATAFQGAAPYELFSKPEPVAAADLNVDGHITLTEFLKVAGEDFDILDKTGRGYLTLEDLPKTPVQAAMGGAGRHKKR